VTRTPDPRITKASLRFVESVGFLPFTGRLGRSNCAYPRQTQTGLSALQGVFLPKALWPNENSKFDLRWTCNETLAILASTAGSSLNEHSAQQAETDESVFSHGATECYAASHSHDSYSIGLIGSTDIAMLEAVMDLRVRMNSKG